jgi:nicotinamide mononucleotide transporter
LFFDDVAGQLAGQDLIEWAGLITGLLYVVLATYEKPSCWIFGLISSACIAWKSFTDYKLVADGLLQLFYVGISIVGLMSWMQGRASSGEKPIVTTSLNKHLITIIICLLISWPVSLLLIEYASARYGYLDTVLTFLSVWATVLLVRKDLHNWIYWIIIDAVFVGLYWVSGAFLFSLLFLVYALISVWGWKQWQKSLLESR